MRTLIAASEEVDWRHREESAQAHRPTPGGAGIALRHLPAIDRAVGSGDTRAARLRDLRGRLADAQTVFRGRRTDRPNIRSTPERLVDHADNLGWADLLVIHLLLDALGERAMIDSLFAQAEADRRDTTSELGGVLTWNEAGEITATPFAPMMRRHDEIYIASDDCINAMHTGLAHYHFHAQWYDNADWAGPGGGDFRFANNLHANCVVFTFIDRDTLNVDIYFPGEAVIDLGCIER